MYYEFYIDQFFLEHLITGYFLLRLTSFLCRDTVPRRRSLLGALANASVMTIAILGGLKTAGLLGIAAAGAAAYGRRDIRWFGRRLLALAFVTVCFGGTAGAVLQLLGIPVCAGVGAAFALLWYCGKRLIAGSVRTEDQVAVKLEWNGQTQTVTGMVDTGNQLTEPLTGRPVSIVDQACAKKLLPEGWEGRRGFYLIPYHSIGTDRGWLRGVAVDRMYVKRSQDWVEIEHPILALYEGTVSAKGRYQLILHPKHTVPADSS